MNDEVNQARVFFEHIDYNFLYTCVRGHHSLATQLEEDGIEAFRDKLPRLAEAVDEHLFSYVHMDVGVDTDASGVHYAYVRLYSNTQEGVPESLSPEARKAMRRLAAVYEWRKQQEKNP